MFQESHHRIRSMSLIHEKLYQSENLAVIDLGDYIRTLTRHLFRSFGAPSGRVRLVFDLASVEVGIDTAVPCGLIVTELVSNVLKYAFPEGQEGTVRIRLAPCDQDRYCLVISDDGIGFPEEIDYHATDSLGLQLVIMLVDQLEGKIELDRREGTSFAITFEELKYRGRLEVQT